MSLPCRRISARNEGGFTLIEQMVVMFVMGIVIAGVLAVFTSVQKNTVRQTARAQAVDELRLVMDRLTRETRQASVIRTTSGPSLLDMDTYVNGVAHRVTYTASGTNLTRAVDGGTALTVLQRLVSTSLFTYTPVRAPTGIEVALRIRPEHFQVDTATVSLSSEVKLRNLG